MLEIKRGKSNVDGLYNYYIYQDDNYILEFNLNDKRNMYNESIRIRNSRSRYNPFNICFMNLYKKLQNYDPNYHQIDIREYILKMNNNK